MSKPSCLSLFAHEITASCSIAVVIICGFDSAPAVALLDGSRPRLQAAAKDIPAKAALSASVAPEVKIIWFGLAALSERAMDRLASSSALKASRPGVCSEFGFMANAAAFRPCCIYGSIASKASSRKGEVAA